MNYKKQRFHEDHRRRGWFSIFPENVVDVNVVEIPKAGTIVAWHRHQRQTDYWAVIKGCLRAGTFVLDSPVEEGVKAKPYHFQWHTLSPYTKETLIIPPNTWHGYETLEPNTILVYGLTNKYDGTDEERLSVDTWGLAEFFYTEIT